MTVVLAFRMSVQVGLVPEQARPHAKKSEIGLADRVAELPSGNVAEQVFGNGGVVHESPGGVLETVSPEV